MKVVKENLDVNKSIANLQLQARFVGEVSDLEIKIEDLIREKYSLSQEMMLHRKKLANDISDDEWNEYYTFVEECIAKAESEVSPNGDNN